MNCEKNPHAGSGYLHDETADGPYYVDGIAYCGRCHYFLDPNEPHQQSENPQGIALLESPLAHEGGTHREHK